MIIFIETICVFIIIGIYTKMIKTSNKILDPSKEWQKEVKKDIKKLKSIQEELKSNPEKYII